jgi:hypothetical protein
MPVAHIIFLFKKGSPFIPAAAISLLPPYLVLLLCSRTPIWPLCGTIKAEPQADYAVTQSVGPVISRRATDAD